MKRPILKKEILRKFRILWKEKDNPWTNGGSVERFAISIGFKGSTAGRELRDMEEIDKTLEKKLMQHPVTKVKSIAYRYRPSEREKIWSYYNNK